MADRQLDPRRAVIGRDRQRALVRTVVLQGTGPHAVVIAGEPGIGKTMVFNEAVDEARDAGHRVLLARCFEEEMTGALVGLGDLLDDVGDLPDAVMDPDVPAMLRGRAVVDVLRRLAVNARVLVAIDDQHWLDDLSARTLRHAVRRLGDQRVVVLATSRPQGLAGDPMMLASGLGPNRATVVDLGPLDLPELRRLVDGHGPISPMTLRRLHDASGGNPMYAIELLRALSTSERAVGLSPSIPLPATLRAATAARFADLPQPLTTLLEVLAVAGPTPIHHLEAHVPELVDQNLLGEASQRGLAAVDEHGRCRFAHPLLGSTMYDRIDPARRRRLHAQLARQVEDPDVRARHLALSTSRRDAGVAAELEQAAERAHVRGAPGAAAMFARHSVRLTPPDDAALSRRRGLIEFTALAAAGEVARAGAALERLVASLPPGPDRSNALMQRYYVAAGPPEASEATLEQALVEAGNDQRLRGHVLDILGFQRGVFGQELDAGIEAASEARAIAGAADDDHLWVRAAGHLAHMQAMAGSPDEATMRAAMQRSQRLGGPELGGGPHAWWAKQLLWAGDVVEARRVLDRVVAWDQQRGYRLEHSYRLYDFALLACAVGDFDEAGELVDRGIEEAVDSGNRDAHGWLLYPAALVAAWRGEADRAAALVDDLLGWGGTAGHRLGCARGRSVLGLVALGTGRAEVAAAAFQAAVEDIGPNGLAHPGALAIVPDLVLSWAYAGRDAEAETALARLDHQVRGLAQPRPRALLDWARGVVWVRGGEFGAGLELLSRAASTLQGLGLEPDAARCRLDEGRSARRAGLRARAARCLDEARATFTSMGAPDWAERADVELRRVTPGATSGQLTPTEQRVAGLVATGLTNREVAARAFMGVSTVEGHLTRIYRRLGIRSRTDLTRMVADGDVQVDESPDGA